LIAITIHQPSKRDERKRTAKKIGEIWRGDGKEKEEEEKEEG
jgi:hypothetical protein